MRMDGMTSPGKQKSDAMIVVTMKETIVDLAGLKLAKTPINPDNP